MRPRRVPLAAQIFLALGLGILAGLCLTAAPELAARLHRQMELYERLPAEAAE